jgi:choline dehydrogenase-like flavoprotein
MENFDVVIIGSGYGGSIPAARLAAAGLKVLVLERGPRLATSDLKQSDAPKDITRVIDLVVTSSNLAYRTGTMVGGASIPMDGAHFRMPQKSFEQTDQAGRPYWPGAYSRAALDPYYQAAEEMLQVRQMGWDEISKSGGLFAKMLASAGASCERARMNYADCRQCGFCTQGCIFDKKMTLLHNYIPFAESHGAEFRSGVAVDHLEPDGTGYRVVHSAGEVFGKRVIVACGGVHTPALLLRSRPHLTNLTPHVGEHFNNNGEHTFIGVTPPETRYACWKGMDNAGLMSFHWFASDGITLHPGGGLEPTLLAARLSSDAAPWPRRAWGMEYKRFVEEVYPSRIIAFSVLGLAPGNQAITVDDQGKVDTTPRDGSAWNAYLDRVDGIIAGLAQTSGVALLPTVPRELTGTTSAHLLSACRMAERAEDGVVDPDCQVFGHENLYVCDASSLPFALGVNPALTISAVAERTAAHILARG